MDLGKMEELEHRLKAEVLTEKEKAKIRYQIYKLQNRPDWMMRNWMMRIFIGHVLLVLLITTLVLTGRIG